MPGDSFHTRGRLRLGASEFWVHRLRDLPGVETLPYSKKVILENLLRHEDGRIVTADDIARFLDPAAPRGEIQFMPSRVFLHDTNGVPVLTDLAAMRDAVAAAGGDPSRVRPVVPGELTVDHSVSTDFAGRRDARRLNAEREYERNAERYRFLRWGSTMENLTVIPPGGGIMHQINLERLARVVERRDGWAFPDTCLGTDSHTTMVSGLGVLGWGVGGVEAEAALLGLPVSMVVPRTVGVELVGALSPGVTATDLVLTLTELLRGHGVVGAIVEFFGADLASVSLETRATIANMAPEYGATTGVFPIDSVTLDYLRLTGRSPDHVAAVETYSREQGLWNDPGQAVRYDQRLRLDLATVEPSLAGPRRPQDRVGLAAVPASFRGSLEALRPPVDRGDSPIRDGAVAIASITSCTNTSNPDVMVAAGLLARNARRRGLTAKPWVKTSLAPGSKAVTRYLERAGLSRYLDELGFQTVGYGCMTCIGNSGDLLPEVTDAVRSEGAVVASVLSGNRNFDGRINNDVGMNYLASPPLVVAYALAGTVERSLLSDPLGTDPDGEPVFLSDIWPDDGEIRDIVRSTLEPEMFASAYEHLFTGDERWDLAAEDGSLFGWRPDSTYVRRPPFLEDLPPMPAGASDIAGARVLVRLGDSVTTDHISPAGRIPSSSCAGRYLTGLGVAPGDLNTYASRRGNFEAMVRGGFANPRLGNLLAPGERGGLTPGPDGELLPTFEAARAFAGVPLLVIAGREYGTGSSRDWAAKVTALLGVTAVLARSFERIHRSNLVQLGVLPLEFVPGEDAESLGLDGSEEFDVTGVESAVRSGSRVTITARGGGRRVEFEAVARIDTSREAEYYRHGGILPFVYRTVFAGPVIAPERPADR